MILKRALLPLAALIGLATVAPATAQVSTRVANTATLSFDAAGSRTSISSNTVALDVSRAKLPTRLSAHLLPVGYDLSGMKCETTPVVTFTPAPIDVATLAQAPVLDSLDANTPIIWVLEAPGSNRDPNVRETAVIDVESENGTSKLPLLETGPNTGVFAGGVPAAEGTSGLSDADVAALSACGSGPARTVTHYTLSFTEDDYSYASTFSLLIDPAGYVFDSATGALVDGATLTLLDANDQPAVVYGDDGKSRYPATVVSGAGATDTSGRVYDFPQGNYRFPLVAPGTYHIKVVPPANYTAPSIKTPDELAKLRDPKNTEFLINDASYGRPFTLATADPFFTDIPLDRQGATQLLLTKVASVREASPGDFVQYKVTIANRGTNAATNVHLTDILPVGLRYELGSTRGAPEPVLSKDGRTLDISAPSVAAGSSQDITYVVSITPGAPVGEALNRVLASGTAGATSNEAAASVRITSLLFTDGFTLIGRVTEGDCGDPNRGRKGIPGIRLLIEDGTFVVTDKDGYYHIEGMRPGRHVVQMDTGSISPAYEPVACDSDTRTAGSAISRFVEGVGGLLKRVGFQLRPTGRAAGAADTLPISVASAKDAAGDRDWFAGQVPGAELLFPTPDYNPRAPVTRVVVKHAPGQHVALFVNGEATDPLNFDTVETNDAKTIALSRWTGIALRDGDNSFEARVIAEDGTVVKVLTRTIHSSGAGVNAVFAPAASRLIADGLTRPLIAVRVTDRSGRPVRDGTLVPFKVDQPYGAAIDADLAQGNQIVGRDKAQTIARVTGDDGLAFIALQPTTQAGNVHVVVSLADEKQTRTSDIRAWLQGSAKDWIVVGFGAGTIGYDTLSTRTKTLPSDMKGGVFTDGQLAFYAKGRIKGSWLATIAYDSDRKIDRTRGLLGTIDPDRYYTVYGDGSRQGYDAPTSRKLYLRLERRNFYALFGDFETGLTEGQLTRYSRTLNGVKTEFDNGRVTFTGFAANTDQLYGRDEIQGNGLSGPYRLSGRDIVPNSDKVRLETRDRLRPELIKSTTALTRNIDYDIDPVAGTLRFRQPVLSRDADLNPVFIIADYETYGSTKHIVTGGRATVKLAKGKVQLGASVIHDESAGNATVAGIDLKAKVTRTTEIRAEAATGGKLGIADSGRAWLAEMEHHDRKLDILAYARSQDTAFGLGQQNVVEAGTRKFGLDGRYAVTEKISITATAWHSQQLDGPGMRDAADVRVEYRRKTGTFFIGGQFANDTGVDGGGRQSRLLTIGGTQNFFGGKLEISGQAQVAPGGEKASVDFPTRQQINAAWRITDGIRLIGGYEIAGGKDYTVGTARVGFDVSPWKGAKLMSTLNQQDIGENGQRTYAQYGLNQSFKISKQWSADFTLDSSQTIRGAIPTGAFVTAFQSTAQGSVAGQYQNDGDYVAVTGGLGYRANKWAWNGRLEYRRSDANTRWGITTDVLRSLGQGRTLAGSFKYYDVTDKNGARASTMTADLALAWRPADSRWSVLDRLQLKKDSADAGFTDTNVLGVPAYNGAFQATLRAINNLAVNYRTGDEGRGHGFEATVYYGSKWVKGSFGSDDYEGYIDATGFELRKDIGPKFDIGIQGSVQHAWERGIWAFSGGPNIGMSPAKNLWLSAGYNVSGYRDRDFEDDRYTRQGPYMTLRMKFDQLSVKGFGRNVLGIGR